MDKATLNRLAAEAGFGANQRTTLLVKLTKFAHLLETHACTEDSARIDWLEKNPRLGEIIVDGKSTDCYLYAVTGATGLRLREIIDTCRVGDHE